MLLLSIQQGWHDKHILAQNFLLYTSYRYKQKKKKENLNIHLHYFSSKIWNVLTYNQLIKNMYLRIKINKIKF